MTREDGIRPTQQGTPLAKDVWMLGIGVGLMVDALTDRPAPHGGPQAARLRLTEPREVSPLRR
jgi:hypothetical protein